MTCGVLFKLTFYAEPENKIIFMIFGKKNVFQICQECSVQWMFLLLVDYSDLYILSI